MSGERLATAVSHNVPASGSLQPPQGVRQAAWVAISEYQAAAGAADNACRRCGVRRHDREARCHVVEQLVRNRGVPAFVLPVGHDPDPSLGKCLERHGVRNPSAEHDRGFRQA